MADGARDIMFADPDRAMLWLRSASGHVPSRSGGRHDVLVAEFSLLVVVEFLLSSREDDTRSWNNFLVYFQMPCQPEGLGIHIYRLIASQAYAKMLV